ncbi:MAG TPA: hypothetical protein VFJ99_00615, partial [Solirubrobacterales bacterium]|nr:hypothetical protein [Solirubrobacterales bacterium]
MRRLPVAAIASACLLVGASPFALGGCGEEGTQAGATVSAYFAAPLCAAADRELERAGGEAGGLRVRLECLPAAGGSGHTNLAVVGANARSATEDSTAIAYVEGPDRGAAAGSRSIVEAAGVAWLEAGSGSAAMGRVLRAVAAAGSGS